MLFAFVVLVCVATSGAYCLVVAPLYDASSSLMVNVSRSPGGEGSSDLMNSIARHSRVVRSQIAVLESETVLRAAIQKVTPAALYPELQQRWLGRLVERVFAAGHPALNKQAVDLVDQGEIADNAAYLDASYLLARRALRVTAAPDSDVISVTFRHGNGAVAAVFLNALVQAYIERDLRLSIEAGIGTFFRDQQAKHSVIYEQASRAFSAFASDRKLYSIQEQRRLTLTRRSELLATVAANESAMSERSGQVASLSEQLKLMKPVSQLPHIARLPHVSPPSSDTESAQPASKASARGAKSAGEANRGAAGSDILAKDPPMLLIRVYQDTIQTLVKTNTEIAGLKAAKDAQHRELAAIDAELALLSLNEAEFERLRLEVTLAKERVEAYAKRDAAQQAEEAMRIGKLSNIQVVQPATTPIEASFPKPKVIIALGTIVGIIIGLAAALLAGFIWDRPRIPEGAGALSPASVSPETTPTIAQIAEYIQRKNA